jgi:hypothetical protein
MLCVGDLMSLMWQKTIELYPKLAVINDDAYKHQILACTNEEAQDAILAKFLASRHTLDEK